MLTHGTCSYGHYKNFGFRSKIERSPAAGFLKLGIVSRSGSLQADLLGVWGQSPPRKKGSDILQVSVGLTEWVSRKTIIIEKQMG
jgi:hypothetical protein